MQVFESRSLAQTEKFAQDFARTLPGRCVITLSGGLGAGKTAFVRGLVKGFGLEDCVSSPTFTIVNEYGGDPPVYHFDLYRLSNAEELLDIGFEEYLENGVCVIEWPDIAAPLLPEGTIDVEISRDPSVGEEYRLIKVTKGGAAG